MLTIWKGKIKTKVTTSCARLHSRVCSSSRERKPFELSVPSPKSANQSIPWQWNISFRKESENSQFQARTGSHQMFISLSRAQLFWEWKLITSNIVSIQSEQTKYMNYFQHLFDNQRLNWLGVQITTQYLVINESRYI